MACKPPLYHGEVDPIVCQRWLSDLEGVFERTHCDTSDFVAYGMGQLRGQAKDWWDNKKKEMGSEEAKAMTWDEFKVPFLKHHSPKAVINRIKEEFIQLRQKGESIDKITGTFLDKLRFCDELVTTEEQKVYYYYNMQSAEYREFMTPSKYETLTEIINVAREREIELKKQIERGERRTQVVNPSPTKKARVNDSSKKQEGKSSSPSCKCAERDTRVSVDLRTSHVLFVGRQGTRLHCARGRCRYATNVISRVTRNPSARNCPKRGKTRVRTPKHRKQKLDLSS
ncbi:putative retrotransposon gag domain-containing protein [Helianthus annuus]|nr:putative retrotransposon gag domain-containing protein [Helianthus annuus]